jgi:hypothetical protein
MSTEVAGSARSTEAAGRNGRERVPSNSGSDGGRDRAPGDGGCCTRQQQQGARA